MVIRPDVRLSLAPYEFAAAQRLAAELGVSGVLAQVMVRRGLGEPDAARAFLAAADEHPLDAFGGLHEAAALILVHVRRRSRITVHGDYDVDGICASAVLIRVLRTLGADVDWYLPSRIDDGYGLAAATVDRLAARGTDLLVTVDCAITAVEEVARAREAGMEVVVTDHHSPRADGVLPDAPIVHPRLGGYPCPDLCAAAVAHKLAQALLIAAGEDAAMAEEDLDLVALATVADVVPLIGENRRLVRSGLRALASTRKPGLRALMDVARVDPSTLDAGAIGFRLGPRLNAAGRLYRADAGLELLLTEDRDRAHAVAAELDANNAERRDVETRILFAAEAAFLDQADQAALVIAGEDWHGGVIGIVASRMVERHDRPCVLIALDGDGHGRGSGRSIAAYDLHAGLGACAQHLTRFGGHRMAAGLELDGGALAAFSAAFARHAGAQLAPGDLRPARTVDAVVPGGALGLGLAEELGSLEPFGAGNREPLLLVPAARIADVRGMGEDSQHARFSLVSGGARARGVAFRTPPGALSKLGDDPHDVALRLEVNQWQGAVEPRLVLDALSPTEPGRLDLVGIGQAPIGDEPFAEALARELCQGGELQARGGEAAKSPAEPARELCDRRDEGVAGVTGDLLSSGDSVLIVSADAERRRSGLARLVAGLGVASADRAPGLVAWRALMCRPQLAAGYCHLVALDPPLDAAWERRLAVLPAAERPAFAHLAWGPGEAEFALTLARAEHDLREPLTGAYRALRALGEADGERLRDALTGERPRARGVETCAAILRVLEELGLIEIERREAGPHCRVIVGAGRTQLERSATFRAHAERLAAAERSLAPAASARAA